VNAILKVAFFRRLGIASTSPSPSLLCHPEPAEEPAQSLPKGSPSLGCDWDPSTSSGWQAPPSWHKLAFAISTIKGKLALPVNFAPAVTTPDLW